jgi:hypothetical protein
VVRKAEEARQVSTSIEEAENLEKVGLCTAHDHRCDDVDDAPRSLEPAVPRDRPFSVRSG